MSVFFGLVIVGIGVFILYRIFRKKKRIKDLKESAGYGFALKIKEELIKNGYSVSDYVHYFEGDASWHFNIYSGTSETKESGEMCCAYLLKNLQWREENLRKKNADLKNVSKHGYYYGIQIDNWGLLISSNNETQDVPKFLRIAALVISGSGDRITHPEWIFQYPEAKKYLNVMFQ